MSGLSCAYCITLSFFTPSPHFIQIFLLQDHQHTCSYFECPSVLNGGMSLCWCWLKAPAHHLRQLLDRKLMLCFTCNTDMFNTVVTDYNERIIWFICLQTIVYDTAFRRESWSGRRKVAVLCSCSCPGEKPTLNDGEMVLPWVMINMAQWEKPAHLKGFWWISSSGSSQCSRGLLPAAIQQQDCMFCSPNVVPWGPANPTGVCASTPSQSGPHSCCQLSVEHKLSPPPRAAQWFNTGRFSFPGHCEANAGYSSPEATLS